jgi:hypothetical protein
MTIIVLGLLERNGEEFFGRVPRQNEVESVAFAGLTK